MNIETIKNRLDELTQIRAQEIEKMQEQIESVRPIESAAKAEMKKAFDVADMKAYYKASGEFRAASEMLDSYQKKLDRLKVANIIRHPECDELSAKIINNLDAIHVEAIKKIHAIVEELQSIGIKTGQETERNIEILKRIEMLLKPGTDPQIDYKYRNKRGSVINIPSSVEQVINSYAVKDLCED